ncbi:serine decarboxylase-like isoform X1 [Silene latifolia]|uniref:serine decarboxylase-like isoform X1 n=1 Tax=Silene latifolia TaxID=37657 RepID=UPI003D770968
MKTMAGTTLTVGLPLDKSQDTAKRINFCENGNGTKGIVVQSKKDKGIVGRRDVEFSCHEIIEPELDPEANADKENYITSVLSTFEKSLQRTKQNLGYALRLDFDYSALGQLPNQVINNFGDPFIEPNFNGQSRKFEVGVLDWFARLWEIEEEEYWGYVTNGSSEGNLHGILLGRELFPEGIFYTSRDSHFSVFKAARMYRMECVTIDTHISGQIDCANFKAKLLQNADKPAIVNVTLGSYPQGHNTTFSKCKELYNPTALGFDSNAREGDTCIFYTLYLWFWHVFPCIIGSLRLLFFPKRFTLHFL